MSSFQVGHRMVGDDSPVFIVAELSANHGGRLETAIATVRAAARAGADAIKLQTYTPDTLTLASKVPPFIVRTNNEWNGRTLHDLYAEAMTPWEWHAPLQTVAKEEGLLLFSTPFDATATEYLERLDVPVHKVASFEIVDLPLVEHVARRGRPMIISTGMASLEEIAAAVSVCREAGNDHIALLRCVSAYPARPETMNLSSFAELRRFGTVVGLSDHTRDITVPVASVALGARIIEKHFIVDRSIGGPDAFFSLDPVEFRGMVDAVRMTERALGLPRFGPGDDEKASATFRRSLFFARDVRAGDVLTCDSVRSVRPVDGLDPRHLPAVLGRVASRDILAATPVSWELTRQAEQPRVTLQREIRSADDASRRSYAIVDRGAVCGTVDVAFQRNGEATVSLNLGRVDEVGDLGADALRALEDAVRAETLVLRSELKTADEACVLAFKRAGYYSFVEGSAGETVRCERRIRSYAS